MLFTFYDEKEAAIGDWWYLWWNRNITTTLTWGYGIAFVVRRASWIMHVFVKALVKSIGQKLFYIYTSFKSVIPINHYVDLLGSSEGVIRSNLYMYCLTSFRKKNKKVAAGVWTNPVKFWKWKKCLGISDLHSNGQIYILLFLNETSNTRVAR